MSMMSMSNYFLNRDKKINKHSFTWAQVFGLPCSTDSFGFPSKVCDSKSRTVSLLVGEAQLAGCPKVWVSGRWSGMQA